MYHVWTLSNYYGFVDLLSHVATGGILAPIAAEVL
jgi:hypothetical protein